MDFNKAKCTVGNLTWSPLNQATIYGNEYWGIYGIYLEFELLNVTLGNITVGEPYTQKFFKEESELWGFHGSTLNGFIISLGFVVLDTECNNAKVVNDITITN